VSMNTAATIVIDMARDATGRPRDRPCTKNRRFGQAGGGGSMAGTSLRAVGGS